MLYNGEQVGDGTPPQVDIAVDPLEGTRLAALGMPERARRDRAVRARHDVRPRPVRVHGEDGRRPRDRRPARPRPARCAETVELVAERKGTDVARRDGRRARPPAPRGRDRGDPRGRRARAADHRRRRVRRAAGGRRHRPVDLLWGIGGTPEGVISAAALKCIGGELIGRLWPRDDEERQAAIDAGYDLDKVAHQRRPRARRRLLLLGHRRHRRRRAPGRPLPGPRGATTESLVMRSRSGTVRRVSARHDRASCARTGSCTALSGGRATERSRVTEDGLPSPILTRSNRPTRDGARSRRASERRNACVTSTWMRTG